jgi:hypothetical protein
MVSEKLQGLIDEAVEAYRKTLEEEMGLLEGAAMEGIWHGGEFSINNLEGTLGTIKKRNGEITEDLIGKAADEAFEKEMLKKNGKRRRGKGKN